MVLIIGGAYQGKLDFAKLVIGNILNIFYKHKRTCYLLDGSVFSCKRSEASYLFRKWTSAR